MVDLTHIMPNPGKYFQKTGNHVSLKRIFWKLFPITGNHFSLKRIFWKIFPCFFLNYLFRVISEEYFWKNFPAEFNVYLLRKKLFWKLGHESDGFPENFSRRIYIYLLKKKIVWKKFPDVFPSHDADFQNLNFYFKS